MKLHEKLRNINWDYQLYLLITATITAKKENVVCFIVRLRFPCTFYIFANINMIKISLHDIQSSSAAISSVLLSKLDISLSSISLRSLAEIIRRRSKSGNNFGPISSIKNKTSFCRSIRIVFSPCDRCRSYTDSRRGFRERAESRNISDNRTPITPRNGIIETVSTPFLNAFQWILLLLPTSSLTDEPLPPLLLIVNQMARKKYRAYKRGVATSATNSFHVANTSRP